MEGVETLALFEEKIALTPRDLANHKINIQGAISSKIAEKLEGKCSLHGWVVPTSSKVLSRSMGYVEKGRFTGDIVFHVQVQAKVLNPPSGSHVVAEVVGNNMMGMYVSYKVKMRQMNKKTKEVTTTDVDAIKIILPRDLHIGDEAFSKVEIGDRVNVEIKKSRFQVNDKYILSVGVFEGKAGSNYVAPLIEEEEEGTAVEQGPSKEAEARTKAFELEEAKKEEAERKEADRTRVIFENEAVAAPVAVATVPLEQAATSGETIYFNAGKLEPYKEFDNRFPAKFTINEVAWPSVEHYYQAMKFPELPDFQEQIRSAPTATAAAKLGKAKDPAKPIRADWKVSREAIMRDAVIAKFDQNPAIMQLLVNTYPKPIVFADASDAFWGYGRTKMGQNKLGNLLVEIRNSHTTTE